MNNIQSIPTYKQFLQVPLELIRQEKLPHAIILNATNGSPSIQIAKLMSLFLLCETQTACGECNNCKMVNNNQHPDILFSYPYFNQKTGTTAEVFRDDWLEFISKHPSFLNEMWDTHLDSGNKQQKIFVAESQRINTFLSLKPYMGKKKIVLVFQADSLVEQASNKLLKAIEEPAPNTHIILISNKIEYVLPTITSRCQIYSIPNLNSEDEFTNYLNFNNINIESQLVTQSEFNPGMYINIVENLNEIKELEKLFIDWLRDCFKLNMKALVSYGDLFSSYNREQIFASISSFISLFRNTFHFDTTEIPKHTSLDLSKLSPFINSNNIDQIYGYMQELMYSIQRNANTRLAMMDTSIKIGMAIRPK